MRPRNGTTLIVEHKKAIVSHVIGTMQSAVYAVSPRAAFLVVLNAILGDGAA